MLAIIGYIFLAFIVWIVFWWLAEWASLAAPKPRKSEDPNRSWSAILEARLDTLREAREAAYREAREAQIAAEVQSSTAPGTETTSSPAKSSLPSE